MKVLLLNPPSPENYIRTGRWTRKSRANQSWPPIWLAYATGLLEREGHECKLLDAGSEKMEGLQTWAITEKYKPDLIAYYYGYDTLEQDLGFADILAKKFRTVLVGPWGYCVPDVLDYVENIDIVTMGEFDHTLLDIANGYSNEDILGIKFNDGYEITTNDNRPLCSSKELDKMPFVAEVYKNHLNMRTYRQTSIRHPFVDIFGARGCPYKCVDADSLITMSDNSEKKIIDVDIDELVKTENGIGTIVQKQVSLEKTITIELENGHSLNLTSDHRVKTKRGWIKAGKLLKTDQVMING